MAKQAGACGREGKSIDLALVGEELQHVGAQICLEQWLFLLEVCIVLDDWLQVHRQRQASRECVESETLRSLQRHLLYKLQQGFFDWVPEDPVPKRHRFRRLESERF